MFSEALGSLGTGPPQTNAERAAALVSRFRQIAELATGVTKDDPGQPIRSIAGTSLDAATAKANPTPDATDEIFREAQNALAAVASPSTVPASAVTASAAAQSTSGDSRVAASPASALLAAGGDTLLGRILTRAMQAGVQRTAAAGGASAATAKTGAAVDADPAAGVPAAGAASTAAQALDAYVRSFTAALERADAGGAAHAGAAKDPSPSDVSSERAGATANTGTGAPAFAAAIGQLQHDAAPATPPAPAPAPPAQPPVDHGAIVDQVLRGVNVHVADGQSEVRLRLVPEQLGDVTVKLVVSGGAVDASMTAHSADAQSALAGAQSQLAKTLADAGLKLQSFTVALAGGSADARDRSGAQPQTRHPSSRRIAGVAAADGSEDASDAALLASPSFGPPIYAAAPGALDYLV